MPRTITVDTIGDKAFRAAFPFVVVGVMGLIALISYTTASNSASNAPTLADQSAQRSADVQSLIAQSRATRR